MSFLSGLFGGGDDGPNPAEEAQKFLKQIPGVAKEQFNPYIDHGQQAYSEMAPQLSQMTQDPSGFINALMKSYAPSRGLQLRKEDALRTAANTAAAGGMRGSLQDIEKSTKLSDRLMGDDMQEWLQNVLGVQQQGIAGEQNLYGTGYDASKSLESELSNVLGQQAQYGFQGARQKQSDKNNMLSNILKLAGTGVGAVFGGPVGAAIGNRLGGAVGDAADGGGSGGFM